MNIHPAADEFPLMDDVRLNDLAQSIRENGQREPIKLYQGMVLDGRNRLRACETLGVAPVTEDLPPDIDPFGYVWDLNGQRRDLTADQRYLIWKACAEKSDEWQAQERRRKVDANRARSEAAKEQHQESRPWAGEKMVLPQPVARPSKPDRTASDKATASSTNRGAVERMDQLSRNRPDLADRVRTGELKSAAAIREMKRDEVVTRLEDVQAKEAKAIEGVYDVIVIDPPWPMEKIERDVAPNQVAFEYPTMSEAELSLLPIPTVDDCHVWLWTTHKYMPMALRLLTAWNMKYVCQFTWIKSGGFQPYGLPQFNTEFAIYARRGSPVFVDTKAFFTGFQAPRGVHSEKPEEFYQVVRRVTAGRRLDMFNRRVIEGFDGWGKEVAAA